MSRPTFVSLFTGIGGLDLGLERAGWRCVAQVEIDSYRRDVLARHWPDLPRWGDIREVDLDELPRADLVCGGFPCQPFSPAGLRLGVADRRWGWPWMERAIRVVGPRYVLVENVAALLDDVLAFGQLLADLAALGFDAEWGVLSACALGAPHTRERLFLVAYPNGSHGTAGLGIGTTRPGSIPDLHDRARAWRDRVVGALEASRADAREADGSARRMVAAGGDAVVPQVAEHVGRLILDAHLSRVTATPDATCTRADASPSPNTAGWAPGMGAVAVTLAPTSEAEAPGTATTGAPGVGRDFASVSDPTSEGEVAVPATAAPLWFREGQPSPGGCVIRRPVLLDDVARLATRSTPVKVRGGIL